MRFPYLFHSNVSLVLYALLYIVSMGFMAIRKSRYLLKPGESMHLRSLIPLGLAAAGFRFIGLFVQYLHGFEAIGAAGDIGPSIVAGAFRDGWSYPILEMLTLAISCVFRYLNQYPFEAQVAGKISADTNFKS